MSLATLLEKIAGRQRRREQAREADFRSIVAEIADGHEPDADLVDRVLDDAGRSLADLREAVELLVKRRALREQVDSLPHLAGEREEVEAQIVTADRALEQAEERHAETTAPLAARLQEVKDAIWAGESAKRDLWTTCPDQDLLAEAADVQRKLEEARRRATELRQAAAGFRGWAAAERDHAERVEGARDMDRAESLRNKAAEFDRKAKDADAERGRVEKAIARLEREERAVQHRMLVP